ncbi:gamma-glutamyl-gamma-aminobutyrate hydrolase family protein [Microbacterium hominis]|uniref:Gamma-glutamyl-gamma-aminobutyrate hydrolase family protein n=1 Tax=Microbacterium hominis TaxID=162426 RepID=A0A7D4UIJ4_9MICO|nr:gamma-glutamyl-gamma-aminobutyrate hydrolase family protein [Microbacterium hominis]QKJ19828.1 gamma-glutamyl-gamma-aminobutyrate hydrolase family protein [Microbacterium hominis]
MSLRVAMPLRLSDGSADARIDAANRIFDDVAALARAAGLDVDLVDVVDLTGVDGVILPGGGDVDPLRYGGAVIDALYDVNPEQDELDFAIARAALDAGLPVLGVCRGLQVLNVLYGGTLVEDLPPTSIVHTDDDRGCAPGDEIAWSWHPVEIAAGSLLAAHTGAGAISVASGHHQGIGALAPGLTAVATAPDGLVEAVEDAARGVIAVQWHPEAAATPAHLALAPFAAFAQLVRQRSTAAAL